MTDARFSGGNASNADDGFGYFPSTSASVTSTPFGGNPGGFGQPAGPATGFGGAMGSTPARRKPSKVTTNLGGFLVIAIVIALVGGGGWWWMHRQAGLSLPTTLAGMPVSDDPALVAAMNSVNTATAANSKYTMKAAVYGSVVPGPAAVVVLVQGKGGTPLNTPAEPVGATHVGPVTCAVLHGKQMVCERVEGERGVAVTAMAGAGDPTLQPETVAAWVQEVWDTTGQ